MRGRCHCLLLLGTQCCFELCYVLHSLVPSTAVGQEIMNSNNGTVHWPAVTTLVKNVCVCMHCPSGRTSEFLIRRTNFRPTAVLIVVYKYVVIKKRNRLIAFFICSARVHTHRDGLRKSYCWWINCSIYKAAEKCLLAYSLFLIDLFFLSLFMKMALSKLSRCTQYVQYFLLYKKVLLMQRKSEVTA